MKPNLLLFVFLTSFFYAQNSSFIYKLNYKLNSDSIKTENIVFFLDIKDGESLFRSEKFRNSDSLRIARGFPDGFDMEYNNNQLYVFKNYNQNESVKFVFVPLLSSVYSIKIKDELKWNIVNEKRTIGKYTCQKAEVNYGDRKWTAWFTTDIPIQDGPYIFKGLPGLIVMLSDERLDYKFTLGEIQNFSWKELYPEKSQKEISWEDFKKLQKSFYSNPFAQINKSDVTSYDDAGNIVKPNFKEMIESVQKKIKNKNNPIELTQKIEY